MIWRRKDWDVASVLGQQLEMNKQTWRALREHGVTEESLVRLDFSYVAPGHAEAQKLSAFLRGETDYDVEVDGELVQGTTQETAISPEILDQWVHWMVVAGYENGRCRFDGWGTLLQ